MPGGDKPKAAKVAATPNRFGKTNMAEVKNDFGSGTSGLYSYMFTDPVTGKQEKLSKISTDISLAPDLKPVRDTAVSGLGNNLGFLQMDPNQRINFLSEGKDPTYNLLTEILNRDTNKALGRATVDAQGTGTMNSTTAGSAMGTILNDQIIRSNTNLLNALNFGNENARADAGLNMNALSGLAGLVNPLGSAANDNLMTAVGSHNQSLAATAQAQNAANMQQKAAMDQYNAQKQAQLGQMIGGGIGLLGTLATGGLGAPLFGAGGLGMLGKAGAGLGAAFNTSGMNGMMGGFGGSSFKPVAIA